MQISVAVKLTFCIEKKLLAGRRNWWYKKEKEKKKEAPVSVLHQIPMKDTERIHMRLLPILVM